MEAGKSERMTHDINYSVYSLSNIVLSMVIMLSWLLSPLMLKVIPVGVGERSKVNPTSVASYKLAVSSASTSDVNRRLSAGEWAIHAHCKYKKSNIFQQP